MTRDQALQKLQLNNVHRDVIEHCLTVSGFAVEIAERIRANGHQVDLDFIETASLLHDIGRCRTHGIGHGVEGARIMEDHPRYARICEKHIGGGITKEEAVELGLPARDYLPETLEEKIICYADKLTSGTERQNISEAVKKFSERLGPGHPTIERIKKLHEEITELAGY
ncbi:MAG: TIGR00295 family protein [Candidatus Altiarchaeales archaeon]|nr:TIGR00295 family protein [Candidatus Altiarchaeales archaeon]MBD3416565.1 TIGR00295 family protein [Candidatus Altiarchaeales archaeon]